MRCRPRKIKLSEELSSRLRELAEGLGGSSFWRRVFAADLRQADVPFIEVAEPYELRMLWWKSLELLLSLSWSAMVKRYEKGQFACEIACCFIDNAL